MIKICRDIQHIYIYMLFSCQRYVVVLLLSCQRHIPSSVTSLANVVFQSCHFAEIANISIDMSRPTKTTCVWYSYRLILMGYMIAIVIFAVFGYWD